MFWPLGSFWTAALRTRGRDAIPTSAAAPLIARTYGPRSGQSAHHDHEPRGPSRPGNSRVRPGFGTSCEGGGSCMRGPVSSPSRRERCGTKRWARNRWREARVDDGVLPFPAAGAWLFVSLLPTPREIIGPGGGRLRRSWARRVGCRHGGGFSANAARGLVRPVEVRPTGRPIGGRVRAEDSVCASTCMRGGCTSTLRVTA